MKLQLLLFIILLLFWNIFIPVLEGADESGHFCHADYIAHRGKLPNLNVQDGCFLWHPPFYYLTLAPIIKAFGLAEFNESQIKTNPNFSLLRKGEYAQFVHTKDELLFKWDAFFSQIHILRLISSIFAIFIFLLTWEASKVIFVNRIHRNLSLLLFFNPMFLHIFSSLTNVTLVSLFASAFIFLELKYIQKIKPFKITFVQGLLIGLGIITKTSIVSLLFAYIFLSFKRFQDLKESFTFKINEILIFVIGILFPSGWYLLRSYKLYGTFFEFNLLGKIDPAAHHLTLLEKVGPLNYANSLVISLFKTFWSGYGALTIRFPEVLNALLLILTLLIVFSIIVKFRYLNSYLKICLAYLVSIFLGLIIANINFAAMHAKDLFLAYLPLSLIFALGTSTAVKVIKQGKVPTWVNMIIIAFSFYMIAQEEIVLILKYFFLNSISDFDRHLLNLSLKFVILLIIYWLILKAANKVSFNQKTINLATRSLFLVNLLILAMASFLFYFKFF